MALLLIMTFTPVLISAATNQIKRTTNSPKIKPAQQHIIRQPDLRVDDMKWSFPLKQGYLVGQNSILNFTLKNQGAVPSGNFTIKFNCPNCPPSMTGIRTISSMAPGTAFGNNWPSLPAVPEEWSAGTYTLEVIIDPNGIVKDSNRANNRKILQFAVTATPNLKKRLIIDKKKHLPDITPQITTGNRIVTGFNFSTQPAPGTTGIRTVKGFNFVNENNFQ